MSRPSPRLAIVFALLAGPSGLFAGPTSQPPADGTTAPSGILGPFTEEVVRPYVWNGDLRDLPQSEPERAIKSPGVFRLTPAEQRALEAKARQREAATAPLAPTVISAPMPPPAANFAGMNFAANGAGWPPDTNGDVGPNHYIQTVNSSIGIYNRATGAAISTVTLNTFFLGPAGNPCDNSNDGDPVVLYDPAADRWIVTDFAWFNFNTGPYYECIAVSQTGDPVAGGWYFYALQTNTGTFAGDYFGDYPKLGVWSDGYYMSANMFEAVGDGFGVRLWALDRAAMLTGGALTEVHFDLCLDGSCGSFLPSNLRGTAPPAGAPNYFMQVAAPNALSLYEFHVDWAIPANSTLTGPVSIPVAPFSIADFGVPQPGTGQTLDTLSFRLMMQLQYRNYGAHESLYAVHTIDDGGIASSRWYEVRDPGGAPALHQQGTHKLADGNHRWMGSIAADQDGNLALGYSVSGTGQFPSIRYAGQRYGEFPGTLPQTEASLIAGTGSQTSIGRWGDYSALSIDPTDDCTFWYTQEYYTANGSNWQTRIGSFKFPACNQPLGTLSGRVYNAVTNADIPGAPVTATGPETLTAQTDGSGNYSLQLLPGTYNVTAGPLLPGYPTPATIFSVGVIANATTTQDIALTGVPNLIYDAVSVVDTALGGNGNGYAEPGEIAVQLFVSLENNGAAPGTGIDAVLSTTTPGVTVTQNTSAYPNLAAAAAAPNTTAYRITLAPTLVCGTILQFELAVTTDHGPYNFSFPLPTGIPQPPALALFDHFESGINGWTTGGTNNLWAQTTSQANSPTHSWTDSPAGSYPDNMDSWLQSPAIDLTGRSGVTVSGYVLYALEPGFDYAYLESSVDGGTTWNPTPLAEWNGTQASWIPSTVPAPALDNQASARLRYRVFSDAGVVDDGFYVDDFEVSFTEILCEPPSVIFVDGFDVNGTAPWSFVVP